METKKLLSIGGRLIFEAAVETTLSLVLAALAGGANLGGADLCGANLGGADLRGANLYGANLCGANLRGANLRGANLRRANLYGADLGGADLGGADLRGANLRRANLGGANLGGANLRGADLCGANLRGADLCGADLRGADLPSPTMVLMANWFEVSVDLCRDLMNYDAACHPNVQKFTEWATGGVCPYSDEKVERAALFKEDKRLYDPTAPACRPYDLMRRLLEEKCPEWTDEQTKEFEERFKK